MAANVEQPCSGFDNLFKRAKRFYTKSKSNGEQSNPNADAVSGEAQKTVMQLQEASIELNSPQIFKSLEKNDRKISNEPNIQSSPLIKLLDSIERSKSKDVNEILAPGAAQPEIRSANGSLQGVRNSQKPSEYCKPEACKNYALSKTLNSDKLTEIINNSIKAAVQDLAKDTNPPCWRQEHEEKKNVTPIESSCFNDTCPGRLKSSQNKENVTSYTQYSQQAIASMKPNVSGNICSIYANNSSKRSYNSHRRTSPRQSPTCCVPSLKSGVSSVICHQSVSKYKKITGTCVKQQQDKPSKPCKPCKPCAPCKPCKPCKHVKADNRRMTGNVNIYICSEGNDGGNKKKKKTESTCNSMTVTNASCACSSTDVCPCQSTSSSKTIRDLMEKRKKSEDLTLKCVCGKLPSDCECLPVQSKKEESEELCLCDMSSLNPTTSTETCRDLVECNSQSPTSSDSSPQGDYCTRRVRSGSSSRLEPCRTRQNFDTVSGVAGRENFSETHVDQSKFTTGNSGRGDAVQECSCCETSSNYSEGKCNVCRYCDVKDGANPPLRNQRERYVPQNNADYSRRDNDGCNCCAYENESLYSSGRKSGIDRSVCCKNRNVSKPQVRPQNKDYCTKPCDPPRASVCDSNNQQQVRYSNFCIMEEDETCDASSCPSRSAKQQNSHRTSTNFQEDPRRARRRDSGVHKDEENTVERQELIEDGKQNDAKIIADDGVSAPQSVAHDKTTSVIEIAKSYTNADTSTSSNLIGFSPLQSPSPLASKDKSAVQPKTSVEKESRRSSLKWPFSKARSLISGKSTSAESKKDKSPANTSKLLIDLTSTEPLKSASTPKSIPKDSEKVIERTANDGARLISITKSNTAEKFPSITKSTTVEKSPSIAKTTVVENSPSLVKGSAGVNSLFSIKSPDGGEADKSREYITENNKTKLSSSRLGSLIAERKNSVQSATKEKALSQDDKQFNGPCYCGAVAADTCTCQYPQCPCCSRPEEDCRCNTTQDRPPQERSCKSCKQVERLCCCCDSNNQQKIYRTTPEDSGFRVCILCCRPENDCRCNSGGQTPRRSRSPSILYNKTRDCCALVCRKSQICLYCEEPRDKCTCRAPIKKCSYCGMPIDVCNCQDVTITCNTCHYDESICQCNGRVIQSSDTGDQSICVTAWQPRRDIRKYFSRNSGERDNPDCSCCETVRPYGSDELPYQRLSVFSDVMTELQQKMSELACCNRCGKTPCCCCLQESRSYSSPTNEGRVCNSKQRKSRSRSPPCCHCVDTSPCKCGGRKNPSYQICDRCRTTPCRCRKSRSTQRKPQAKCYYCKSSPCRCESSKATKAPSKSCRCNSSPTRSQVQAPSLPDRSPERNPPGPRPRSCRCRCGSPNCGSPPRGQERPC